MDPAPPSVAPAAPNGWPPDAVFPTVPELPAPSTPVDDVVLLDVDGAVLEPVGRLPAVVPEVAAPEVVAPDVAAPVDPLLGAAGLGCAAAAAVIEAAWCLAAATMARARLWARAVAELMMACPELWASLTMAVAWA